MINCAGCGASVATPGLCYACGEAAKRLPLDPPLGRGREVFEKDAGHRYGLDAGSVSKRLNAAPGSYYSDPQIQHDWVIWQAAQSALARENEALKMALDRALGQLAAWKSLDGARAEVARLTTPAGGAR